MRSIDWVKEFPAAITIVDAKGTILDMNDRACKAFVEEGGAALIGTQILDCHPEPARGKLAGLMEKRIVNCYTIEKQGKWKMIYQSPWYEGRTYAGFIEISMEIPASLPHFVRGE
jgi:hypothetical protein